MQVTLQSFLWSKLLKERGTEGRAAAAVARGEAAMAAEPAVSVDDIFAFRQGALCGLSSIRACMLAQQRRKDRECLPAQHRSIFYAN